MTGNLPLFKVWKVPFRPTLYNLTRMKPVRPSLLSVRFMIWTVLLNNKDRGSVRKDHAVEKNAIALAAYRSNQLKLELKDPLSYFLPGKLWLPGAYLFEPGKPGRLR